MVKEIRPTGFGSGSTPTIQKFTAAAGTTFFSASDGVSVTRGRLPGATTLNGFSASSSTKLCIRWLIPMPLLPAMHAGNHPPLGVTEIAQPFSSAA